MDIAIKDARIAKVGALGTAGATARLDARGLVAAPGFIDVHTHADDLASRPQAENFIRMGVTSIVAGNCGLSALDGGRGVRAYPGGHRRGELRDAHRSQHGAHRRHGPRRARSDARRSWIG